MMGFSLCLVWVGGRAAQAVCNTWTLKFPMFQARAGLAAAAIDGKLYAVGGAVHDVGGAALPVNTLEVYDPVTDRWTFKRRMPTPRLGLAAAAIDGKLYAAGGNAGISFFNTLEVYDPVANTWTTLAPMPRTRSGLAAAAIGGQLYAAGGSIDGFTEFNDLQVYQTPAIPTITAGGPTTFCAGGSVTLTSSSATGNQWSLNNNPISGATNQTFSATASGSYTVIVTANGCPNFASTATTVTVNPLPAVPAITATPTSVCASSTGNKASGPAGATTYAWTITNGTITSATNIQTITYTAGASGTVQLGLTVTNAAGCSRLNTASATINALPGVPTITATPAQLCGGSSGNMASGPAGAASYAWTITNGTITSLPNIQTITYIAGGSSNVLLMLTVTNAAGCRASNTLGVPGNTAPTDGTYANTAIAPGGGATVTPSAAPCR